MTLVGGFFGVEFPPSDAPGLGGFWGMPEDPALCYANCRSALAALLRAVKPGRLWLPAYICTSVAAAADGGMPGAAATPVGYFPVDEFLEPDAAYIDSAVRAGDMVLAVDYFGRAPGARFRDFVRARSDLKFVEDACQAFDTGVPQWGHWALRSPRKLVGVPDGGFIVPAADMPAADMAAASMAVQRSLAATGTELQRAALLRFEDEGERDNARWHDANQAREAAEEVSLRRMSRLSRELLVRLPVAPLAERRRANFSVLAQALAGHGFLVGDLDDAPDFVPMGFPIRLRPAQRGRIRDALIACGIFPAMHWSELPSPANFVAAHSLAGELMTLPCDHRYSSQDMQRVAQVVLDALRQAS